MSAAITLRWPTAVCAALMMSPTLFWATLGMLSPSWIGLPALVPGVMSMTLSPSTPALLSTAIVSVRMRSTAGLSPSLQSISLMLLLLLFDTAEYGILLNMLCLTI